MHIVLHAGGVVGLATALFAAGEGEGNLKPITESSA